MHYRTWPAPEPLGTLVFLHGRGQHSGNYHRFASLMVARGLSVWALDHIGHGLTEGEVDENADHREVESYLSDIGSDARTLVELTGDPTPSIMGHSLGTAAAVRALAAGTTVKNAALIALPPMLVSPEMLRAAATSPTIAMHGVDDRIAPIGAVRELVAASEVAIPLHEYADTGHDLLHEKVHRAVTEDAADHLLS